MRVECFARRARPVISPTNHPNLHGQKIKLLLLECIQPSATMVLRAAGYTNIESVDGPVEGDELLAKVADAHFVVIRSSTQLTAFVFVHAYRLAAVGCFCIGTNQVDLVAAR